ncbi:polysaccharide deacetylase family protein, partial [Bradyrhizobium sp. SHOUNA76]|nr:polysaccharide deacetylase family protein [Bradyrhizobium sp. SHOUNA76]
MRVAAGLILASAISLAMTGAAWSQTPAAKPAAATQAAPAATP